MIRIKFPTKSEEEQLLTRYGIEYFAEEEDREHTWDFFTRNILCQAQRSQDHDMMNDNMLTPQASPDEFLWSLQVFNNQT